MSNSRTSQFMFPKYLTEYQNIKIDVVLKENEKKDIKVWPSRLRCYTENRKVLSSNPTRL